MRSLFLSTLIICAVAARAEEARSMSSEETEVLRLESEFVAAWRKADARAVAAFYADDGVRVGAFGDVARGRKEIESAFERLFSGPMKGATIEVETHAKLIAQDVVVVQGPLMIKPVGDAPAIRGYALDIWKRLEGRWRVIEAHPKLFPPPHSPKK